MPQEISLLVQSQSDTSGLSSTTASLKDLESSVANASSTADKFGTNYDALFSRMERPLGRVAFHGLAADILASDTSMTTATGAAGMLAQGLHAVGNAAVFAGGEFAMIAIGAVAVYEIYEKLFSASDQAAKSQADIAKENSDASKSYSDLASQLKTLGPQYGELASRMQNASEASKYLVESDLKKAIADTQAQIAEEKRANSIYNLSKGTADLDLITNKLSGTTMQNSTAQKEGADAITKRASAVKDLSDKEQTLIKISASYAALESKKQTVDPSIRQVNELMAKRADGMQSVITATYALMTAEGTLANSEKKYISETDSVKKKALAEEILSLNKTITAEQETLKKEQEIQKQKETLYKQQAAMYEKYMGAITDCVTANGSKVVFEGRKFLGQELEDLANQAASYLSIQAAKYFGSGNYFMGTAALAAAAVVKTAAAVGAAALEASAGGDNGTSSSSSSDAGSSASSLTSVDSATTNNLRPLQLSIQVNALHSGTAQELGVQLTKLINQAVDQSGAQLKATALQVSGPWVAV